MVGLRKRGEKIRRYVLDNVDNHPRSISKVAAEKFGISRQAVNKHIKRLVEQGSLLVSGTTRNRKYALWPEHEINKLFEIDGNLQEDIVWRGCVAPLLSSLPDNVRDIWHYGVTKMVNNVIDHSVGDTLLLSLKKTARETGVHIMDDGIGIFNKIQQELGLQDKRHAVLELSKGKLTTDPARHSGEGIFFTSRMFDRFGIMSEGIVFSHQHGEIEDWILETKGSESGTTVFLYLSNTTSRTVKSVFDQFTTDDDYGFNKTVVPVTLAQYGDENLVSRSQARRMLARVDRFKAVILDFKGVEMIGQAFADETFRVFVNFHPDVELVAINTNASIESMISRAKETAKQVAD